MVLKMKKKDLMDVKKNPWFNWTYPNKTKKVHFIKCGKKITAKKDKVTHSWARYCSKCHKPPMKRL